MRLKLVTFQTIRYLHKNKNYNTTTQIIYRPIGIIVRVFAYGPGVLGSVRGQVIPKI